MSVVFSRHALERIYKGDENGLRTVLAPKEIEEILYSDIIVPFAGGYVFYSIRDEKCLYIVMGRNSGDMVVSVVPADRVDWWVRLLAERKAVGGGFFVAELPPVTSWTKADSVHIGCVVEEQVGSRWRFDHEESFFCWLDYQQNQTALLRSRGFHEAVVASLEECRERTKWPHFKIAELFARGVGWQRHLPVSFPYDFLGKKP